MSNQKVDNSIITKDVLGLGELSKNGPDYINKAIETNDIEELRVLLKQGFKSDFKYPFSKDTDPQIAELLAEYHYLPQGLTLSTLKFSLFLMGNTKVAFMDFWDKPDLNPNGYYQNIIPIKLYAKDGNVPMVAALMKRGAIDRPLDYLLLVSPTEHFVRFGFSKSFTQIDTLIKNVSDIFDGKNPLFSNLKIIEQCRIIELFFHFPNQELESSFSSEEFKLRLKYGKGLTSFMAWAARYNKAELVHLSFFKKYFQTDKYSAYAAILNAAAFGSVEFLVKANQEGLLNYHDISLACTIAAVCGNEILLTSLMKSWIAKEGNSTEDHDVHQIWDLVDLDPLKWAIMKDRINIVELLLEAGVPPGEYGEPLIRSSHLALSTFLGNAPIVRLLIAYGADINQQDYCLCSALHIAAEKNNIELLQILILAGADTKLVDNKGRIFLESITDNSVLQNIQEFIRAEKNNNPHLSDDKDKKSSQSAVKVIDLRLFKENPIQYRLNKLIQHYNELEAKHKEFKEAVSKAYKNQSPPLNHEYQIQETDFSDCQSKKAQFLQLYDKTIKLLNFHCDGKMFPDSYRIGVKEGFKSYEEKIIGYQKDVIHEMSADSHGLAYYYKNQRPEDRDVSAIEVIMDVMFGN
ncbi:MAG: ankyrin repeat domain-containing protein [Legionella sp.]|jgi:hypothetical protein